METKRNPLVIVLVISFLFFLVFLAAVGFYMKGIVNPPSTTAKKSLFSKSNQIGVIELNGAIMDSKKWLEQIEQFEEDNMVKGVIVRINSPGGAVGPSQEIHDAVKKLSLKKPTYVSMGSVCASGGYYVAVAAKKIYATPGTITASIGVIMQFADMSKLFQWAKVSPYNIKTGKYKDVGNPAREMSEEERDLLQKMIMNVLAQFRKAVSEGRKLPMDKVIEISDGRIMSGEQAKDLKLVDELGGINDTAEALAKEVGIQGKPQLVYISKKKHFLEAILSSDDEAESDSKYNGNIFGAISQIANALSILSKGNQVIGGQALSEMGSNFGGPMYILPNIGK